MAIGAEEGSREAVWLLGLRREAGRRYGNWG